MFVILCLIGLVVMDHSILMLLNHKYLKKSNGDKVVKTNSIIAVIANILGITALFLKGLGQIDHILVNILLFIPFVVGIIIFVIRLYYKNKQSMLKSNQNNKKRHKKNRG